MSNLSHTTSLNADAAGASTSTGYPSNPTDPIGGADLVTDHGPMLPLPPAVLARLRTAETLRAEVAALTTERDALREELQTAAWERDTAQGEASYMREEIIAREANWRNQPPAPVGRLLTMGDVPPAPPEDERGEDIALVSLSTGEVRVRAHKMAPDQWSRYGETSTVSDFATLAESGPWITVNAYRYRDHRERGEKRRRLRSAVWAGYPGKADYPPESAGGVERLEALSAKRASDDEDHLASMLGAWQMLASTTRMAWDTERRRSERRAEILRGLPHEPFYERSATQTEHVCAYCGAVESEHVTSPTSATADA